MYIRVIRHCCSSVITCATRCGHASQNPNQRRCKSSPLIEGLMQACCHAGGKTSLHACVAAIVALQMQPGSSHTCDNLMDWTELLVQHMPGPKQRCKTAYNSLGCWYIPEKNGQTNQEQCAAKLVYILFG